MAVQIERKFLVEKIPIKLVSKSEKIKQWYIILDNRLVIRLRSIGNKYFLTIKGNTSGISRLEFEYSIPKEDAMDMFHYFCGSNVINKTRHYIKDCNHIWEIDEFHGQNDGLIIAEIELYLCLWCRKMHSFIRIRNILHFLYLMLLLLTRLSTIPHVICEGHTLLFFFFFSAWR